MVTAVRTSDRIYSELRDEIVTLRLGGGTALSEVDLAERLGVSRTPLRAALSRLALEGLVDTSRGRTGVVSEVSANTVSELFELREALEVQAARLAARRCVPLRFQALATEFADPERTLREGGPAAYYHVVDRFDAAVDDAVGNRALRIALDTVRMHLARARRLAADNRARLVHAAVEHRMICLAIADRDEQLAASATTVHLRSSLTTILSTLTTRSPTDREDPR